MKNILTLIGLIALGISVQNCTSSSASTVETTNPEKAMAVCATPPQAIDYSTLERIGNPEVIQRLGFPATITYIGLDEPRLDEPRLEKSQNVTLGTIPNEMALIPGGNVQIGSDDGFGQELPVFWASVKPFLLDKHPVTVAQFRAFVKATNYVTEAEKFGDAGVIDESTNRQWVLVKGANWEYPLGKTQPKAPDNHPVTQVSWNDANAYAKWAGKRLPCEIEWEHAARNAKNTRSIYSWGNKIETNGKWKANVWQGTFPIKNYKKDQFAYTSPVGIFGTTSLGLTDMSGNVWEWTSNKKFDYVALFKKSGYEAHIKEEYAERGGSFLCEPTWCHGYRVSGRAESSAETSLFHLGFRCAKDI